MPCASPSAAAPGQVLRLMVFSAEAPEGTKTPALSQAQELGRSRRHCSQLQVAGLCGPAGGHGCRAGCGRGAGQPSAPTHSHSPDGPDAPALPPLQAPQPSYGHLVLAITLLLTLDGSPMATAVTSTPALPPPSSSLTHPQHLTTLQPAPLAPVSTTLPAPAPLSLSQHPCHLHQHCSPPQHDSPPTA